MRRILTREDKLGVSQALWDMTPEKVGPFDGGCLALARALERLGGEIEVLADRQDRAQHAVARFGRWVVDFNGAFNDEDMLEVFSRSEHVCVYSVRPMREGDLSEAHQDKPLVDAIELAIGEKSRRRLLDLAPAKKNSLRMGS